MRKNLFLIATMASAALMTVNASAITNLYFNNIDQTGNAFSSQNDTSGGNGNYATVFAYFTTAAGSQITQAAWVGEFFNPAQHANITGFTVNFYSDNAGTVGGLVQSEHFNNNGNESFLGTFGGFDSYVYIEQITPLSWSGAGWVSAVADLGFPPQWGMAAGVGGPNGYQDFFGTRSPLSSSVAIEIDGNAAVPEPASMAALGLGVAALIRRRRASK